VTRALARRIQHDVGDSLASWEHDQRETSGRSPSDDETRVRASGFIAAAVEHESRQRIEAGEPPLGPDVIDGLVERVESLLFSLGDLDRYLNDPFVENIFANGCDRVFFTTADGHRHVGSPIADSDDELVELIRRLASRSGRTERRFDDAQPVLNLRLADGSRLFAVMQVSERPSLSIRRHRYPTVTLDELVTLGTIDETLRAVLAAAVSRPRPLNIVVCGGTDTGKTTLLRALINDIDPWERVVVIEDSLELHLAADANAHPNVVELETREPNVEGAGEISMRDLTRNALRMAPDRVIVGEVRGGEVVEMLLAMSQGNDGSMCTLHADSSHSALAKIATYASMARERLPIDATNMLIANSVHLVVHLAKAADGRRVVSSIREITGSDGHLVLSNEVFSPDDDGIARFAHPFTDTTLRRLAANGFDPSVLHTAAGAWR
jgi:pilus assembly protein CpaF